MVMVALMAAVLGRPITWSFEIRPEVGQAFGTITYDTKADLISDLVYENPHTEEAIYRGEVNLEYNLINAGTTNEYGQLFLNNGHFKSTGIVDMHLNDNPDQFFFSFGPGGHFLPTEDASYVFIASSLDRSTQSFITSTRLKDLDLEGYSL